MTKANLTYKSERLFGDLLPTVYFKSIQVGATEEGSVDAEKNQLKVTVDCAIGFTKPDGWNDAETQTAIDQYLEDLWLYVWVSPHQKVNADLEKSQLNIYDIEYYDWATRNPNIESFDRDHLFFENFETAIAETWASGEYAAGVSTDKDIGELMSAGLGALTSQHPEVLASFGMSGNYGDTVSIIGMFDLFNHNADLTAFTAWAMDYCNRHDTTRDQIVEGIQDMILGGERHHAHQLGSINDRTSMKSYLIFGDNYDGPWDKRETFSLENYQKVKSRSFVQYGGALDGDFGTATYGDLYTDETGTYHGPAGKADEIITEQDAADFVYTYMYGGGTTYGGNPLAEMGETIAVEFPEGLEAVVRDMFGTSGMNAPLDDTELVTDCYAHKYFSEAISTYSTFDYASAADKVLKHKKIRLKHLAGGLHGGRLVYNKTYDADNKEVFKISNIKLEFKYDHGTGVYGDQMWATDFINSLHKVFLIATVGVDLDDYGPTFTTYDAYFNGRERAMMNRCVGNITYEHILKNGVVPNPYYEHYQYADGSGPYDGIPTQGLNGKIYADNILPRKQLIDQYKKLIAKHKGTQDKQLKKNLANLELVLRKYKNSPALVQFIKRYQKTYVGRAPHLPSGKFYIKFRDLMIKLNNIIISQKEIKKKISLNSIVMDIRPHRATGDSYLRVWSNNNYHLSDQPNLSDYWYAGEYYDANTDYISYQYLGATKIFRNLEYIDVRTPGASHELKALRDDVVTAAASYYGATGGTDTAEHLGIDADTIEAAAEAFLEHEAHMIDENSGVDVTEVDMIAKNHGYFFFDLEKAIHTRSQMSNTVDLRKLQVFLSLTVPYTHFYVNAINLIRNDLSLAWDPDDDVNPEEMMVKTRMRTTFRHAASTGYPAIYTTSHSVEGAEALGEPAARYGKPSVVLHDAKGTVIGRGDPEYSMVKWTHFDVARDCHSTLIQPDGRVSAQSPFAYERHSPCLKDFGDARGYPTLTPGHHGNKEQCVITQGIGQPSLGRTSKSYRMMGFEFTDFMDDDVAILNSDSSTRGSDGRWGGYGDDIDGRNERLEAIARINPDGQPCSWYDIEIEVRDQSLKYFTTIYPKIIAPLERAFKEYADYAEELCSYNSAEEEFNQFFVDAMVERYVEKPKKEFTSKFQYLVGSLKRIQDTELGNFDSYHQKTIADIDLDKFSLDDFAKSFPPWISGALLISFMKEIFFNRTVRTDYFRVFYSIVTAMSSYNPESDGPPDPETVAFIREMYSLTPQKGNLPAISSFLERIEPLLAIVKLDDVHIRDRISDLTGIPADADDFKTQVEDHMITWTFKQRININTPLSPGKSRYYVDDISDSYIYREAHPHGAAADGMDAMRDKAELLHRFGAYSIPLSELPPMYHHMPTGRRSNNTMMRASIMRPWTQWLEARKPGFYDFTGKDLALTVQDFLEQQEDYKDFEDRMRRPEKDFDKPHNHIYMDSMWTQARVADAAAKSDASPSDSYPDSALRERYKRNLYMSHFVVTEEFKEGSYNGYFVWFYDDAGVEGPTYADPDDVALPH